MEPLPETREALAELVSLDDPDVDEVLAELGRSAQAIVPELVGLSLGLAHEGLTLTLLASNDGVCSIDAAQYVEGGPCVEVTEGRLASAVVDMDDPLDEERWQLFSQVSAASGVASSLSLPVYRDDRLVGGVNLYASGRDSFTGRQDQLVEALGGRAGEAVANADLSFSTRLDAAEAPQQMRERIEIETATGLLAARSGSDLEAAQRLLREAAARAGISAALVARVLVLVHRGWPSP
jgi:GAF domain-containing protein